MRWILIILLGVSVIPVFAAPGQLCWESTQDMCGLLSNNPAEVFGAIQEPLNSQFSGLFLIILWGGILGVIWFKTENIMLLGIVGILISTTVSGLSEQAQGIGMMLLAISIGILLFQLIRQRINVIS